MKIYTKQKKCYVFDFDDVLVKTKARIYVKLDNNIKKYLTSSEYAGWEKKADETYDFSEFYDSKFIEDGEPCIMFNTLININNAIDEGRSNSVVYILTARESHLKRPIHDYLTSRGVYCVPIENIITVGDNKELPSNISKYMALNLLLDKGFEITFFDDDIKNIEIASNIPGVKTRYVNDDI